MTGVDSVVVGSALFFLGYPASSDVVRAGTGAFPFLRKGMLLPWLMVFEGDLVLWPVFSKARLSLALVVTCCGSFVAPAPAAGRLGAPPALMV